jgi:hypothetical protein
VFFIIIQQKIIQNNEQANDAEASRIVGKIVNEIKVAESVSDDYYRVFTVPNNLNGIPYTVTITQGIANTAEIALKYSDKEKVYFLEQYVFAQSTLCQGYNNITKTNGVITIQGMSC